MPIASTFEDSLTNNNHTGVNDIIIDSYQVIKSDNGGGQISLDIGGSPNSVSISTDNDAYGESYLYMDSTSQQTSAGVYTIYGTTRASIETPTFLVSGLYNGVGRTVIYYKDNATQPLTLPMSGVESPSICISSTRTSGSGLTQSISANSYTSGLILTSDCSIVNSSYFCNISNSLSSNIYGSQICDISNSFYSSITQSFASSINGVTSTIKDSDTCYTFGYANDIDTKRYCFVMGGFLQPANGGFNYGDVNGSGLINLDVTTTNNTPSLVTFWNKSGVNTLSLQSFRIANNTSVRVQIVVVAINRSTGDTKEWSANGLIKNIGGTTALVGTLTFTSTFGDASLSTTTVTGTANNTTDALDITVTGLTSTTIEWNADIKYVVAKM